MTWGQFRLLLQTELAGASLDLIDQWLNNRYEQVLQATNWIGRKYHATVQTIAAYQSSTDSTTLTVGQANVVGVGTAWTAAATLGMKFYRPGDTVIYTVIVWNSATSITLDRPYEGNGVDAAGVIYTAASYVFMQNVYTLPADVDTVVNALDPITGRPLQPFSKEALDASTGPRTLVENPTSYAITDDTNEAAPPVLHQIEFYPPPVSARGIPIEYLHAASGFDGSNTGAGPMPWVSNSVLLSGAKADGYAYLAGSTDAPGDKAAYLKLAMMHETQFNVALARLLLVEHTQRRQKRAVQMADRFTRHRLARAARGFNSYWGTGQGGPN